MKKRILSMLLAIVMVVTALPLLVFTAMAEEAAEPEYPTTTVEEYNALYVTFGRIFQNDFFSTNEYWAPDTHSTPIAIENGAVGITGGDAVNSFTPYIIYRPNYYYMFTCTKAPGNVTIHDGYVDIPASGDVDFANSRTANFSDRNDSKGTMAAVNPNYKLTVTVEYVMNVRSAKNSSGVQTSSGQPMFQLGGITIVEGNAESNLVFRQVTDQGVAITDGNLLDGQEHFDRFYAKRNKVNTFTLKVDRPQATLASGTELHTENGYLGLMVNGVDYFESSTVKYVNSQANPYQINYVNVYTSAAYYATRVYNRVLDDFEVAQNHFADLAKYFRLDISSYNEWKEILSQEEMHKALLILCGYHFDNTREEVQNALDTCFEKALYGEEYFESFASVVDSHILAVAEKFNLDLDVFKILPVGFLKETVNLLASYDLDDETLTETAVKAAYIAAVENDVWGFAGESTLDEAGYNALYKQDGIVVWYDFFKSNKHWGGDYSDGTRLQMTGGVNPSSASNQNNITAYRVALNGPARDFFGQNGTGAPLPTLGDGYLDFSFKTNASFTTNGIGFWGRTGGNYPTLTVPGAGGFLSATDYTLSLQYIAKFDDLKLNNHPDFTMSSLGIKLHNDGFTSYVSAVNDDASYAAAADLALAPSKDNSFMMGETVDLTTVIKQPIGSDATVAQPGLLGIYLNNKTAYKNESFAYTKTASTRITGYQFLFTGAHSAKTYAFRIYNVALTVDDIEKNHFADIAKWYKLGLVGWSELTADEKGEIYKAFADLTIDDYNYTRAEAEAVYIKAYANILKKDYDVLKAEYAADAEKLAFIELAADWLLPLDTLGEVLASKRDMSYVYANVTAETLLAADNGAALLERAYEAAYKYYSYANGESEAFINKAASLGLDISAAMTLPKSDRAAIYALDLEALTQDALNEAVAAISEKYASGDTYDKTFYNSLYETTGLVMQHDFFDSNEYWGGAYSNVSEEERLVMADTNIHTGVETLLPYKQFVVNLTANRLGLNGAWKTSTSEGFEDAIPSVGNGYLKLYPKYTGMSHASSGGFGVWGRSGDSYASYMMRAGFYKEETYTLSVQYVFAVDSVKVGNAQLTLGNVHMILNTDANGDLYFITVKQGATSENISAVATNPHFAMNEVIDYTQVIQQAGGATASAGLFEMFINGKSAYKNTSYAYTTAPASQGVGYHMLWTGNYSGSAYAVRFYNAVLDDTIIERNHFADVAKWYKLSLIGWNELSDDEKQIVYKDFADVTVNDPRYERADAQTLYIKALDKIYNYSQYKNGNAAVDAFVDLAALAGMPVDTVAGTVALPNELRNEIVTVINEEFSCMYAEDYVSDILSYWINDITEQKLDERYGSYAYTQEDYNKLYAQQDHLLTWFDFFSATEGMVDYEGEDGQLTNDLNKHNTQFGSVAGATAVPSVFRAGVMNINNITSAPAGTVWQRSLEDGYFRMQVSVQKSNDVKYPNIDVYPDARYSETDMMLSDYTWEIVASDFDGSNYNIQIDNLRLGIGNNGEQVRVRAVALTNPRVDRQTNDSITKGDFLISQDYTVSNELYTGNRALGATYTIRYDKDFTVQPVVYSKVTPDANGKYVYDNASEITKEEAMSLLKYTGAAEDFDAYLGVPDANALTEWNSGFSDIHATEEAEGTPVTYVYAYRYSAKADVDVRFNNQVQFDGKLNCGASGGYILYGFGTGVNMNVYSMRRYDIVLTDAELAQNHFVDLCKYYGLNIGAYLALDEEGRAAVHEAMKSFLIKDEANYDAMMTAYRTVLATAYYNNLKVDGEEAYNAFIESAALNMLDLSALLTLPESLRLEIGNADGIAALGVERSGYIANGLFAEILQKAIPETDPGYLAKQLISFSGYSVRVSGSYDAGQEAIAGIRSTFVINEELLTALIENGQSVVFGASVTNPSNGKSQSITVYNAGNGTNVVGGFTFAGNAYERANALGETELCYTYTTLYDAMNGTPWSEIDFSIRKAVIEKELAYSYFIEIDGERYEFACQSPTFGETVSSSEVYGYFRNVGEHSADAVIGDIIGIKHGTDDKATLYNVTFNGKSLADMKIVYGQGFSKDEAKAVAEMLYELTAVEVEIVEQGTLYSPYLVKDEEAKAEILWLTADTLKQHALYGDDYLDGAQFGCMNHYGAFTFLVNDNADCTIFADALRAYMLTLADENGNIALATTGLTTFSAAE